MVGQSFRATRFEGMDPSHSSHVENVDLIDGIYVKLLLVMFNVGQKAE